MKRRTLLLDALGVLAFAVVGVYSHHHTIPSLSHLMGVYLPFLAGWLLVALLTRLYSAQPLRGAYWLTWLVGSLLGVALYSWVVQERSISLQSISPVFWLISTVAIGLFTGALRGLNALLQRRHAGLAGR
ncbi:MAG: DUF3054 domain-containing protein [Fimbriimonadales bacterium]